MLYDGKNHDREYLRTLPVPETPPFKAYLEKRGAQAGRFWQPIQHGELADTIVDRLEASGLQVADESWSLCRKGHGLVGSVDLIMPGADEGGVAIPEGSGLSFGVRHSNDGNWALTCLVGGKVQVCSNGILIGDFVMSRKHTTGNELETTIDDAIERYLEQAAELSTMQQRLTETDLSNREGDSLILTMAEEKAYPWRLVPEITKQWRYPDHPEFQDRNAWSLYMAVTEAAKVRSPRQQVETLGGSRDVLLAYEPEAVILN